MNKLVGSLCGLVALAVPSLVEAMFLVPCTIVTDHYSPEVRYTVKPGDNLRDIAQRQFGSGLYFHGIVERNSSIKDPNKIYVGQELVLREREVKSWKRTVSEGVCPITNASGIEYVAVEDQ